MRPGVLFGFIFVWLVCTGGRFTAPFLEDVAKFNESLIGLAFGLQILFGSIFAGYGSMKADEMEMKYPGKGRVMVLVGLLIVGTIGIQLHFLIYYLYQRVEDENQRYELTNEVVILHITARVLFSICSTLIFPILDGVSIAYLKETNADEGDYGKERLFGAVGWAIASLLIGPLLDKYGFLYVFFYSSIASCVMTVFVIFLYIKDKDEISSEGKSTSTESASVITSEAKTQLDDSFDDNVHNDEIHDMVNHSKTHLVLSDKISPEESPKERKKEQELTNELKDGENRTILKNIFDSFVGIGFMISTVTLCIGTSVVENLIFLYFQDELGGSNSLCGVSILVTVIFEVPIFHFSSNLLAKYGPLMLQKVACLAYIVRVVGYTFIPEKYVALVLLFEPLHGVTYACSKTASVDFASASSPPGYESTGQGIMSMFQGLGIILGLGVGGWIEDTFSAAVLYRSYAFIVTLGLSIFHAATIQQSLRPNATIAKYEMVNIATTVP